MVRRAVLQTDQHHEDVVRRQVDGGGLRGLVPAGMLEGVEDMIKQVARDHNLTGTDADGNRVTVDDTSQFSVLAADYFDIVAGASLEGCAP